MTPTEIDRQLAARGIRYDVGDEEFYDGNRLLEPDEVLALLPGLNFDELASYADSKYGAAIPELWGDARFRFRCASEPDDES